MTDTGCAYCGRSDPETVDHVPPKTVFPKPRPSGLITVPCCSECREGTSLDDEYFRDRIAMRGDVAGKPEALGVLDATMRSFKRPQKRRHLRALMDRVAIREVWSDHGILAARDPVYEVKASRIYRVVNRTVRGLLYHHTGQRTDADAVQCVGLDFLDVSDDPSVGEDFVALLKILSRAPEHEVQPGVFRYRFQRDGGASLWTMVFFERVIFLAYVS